MNPRLLRRVTLQGFRITTHLVVVDQLISHTQTKTHCQLPSSIRDRLLGYGIGKFIKERRDPCHGAKNRTSHRLAAILAATS